MVVYSLKKILSTLLLLFFVLFLSFLLVRMIPGGPFDHEKALPTQIKKNLEAKYGFNHSPLIHFSIYLQSLLKGDMGVSLKFLDRPVFKIIKETLPISFSLGFLATLLAVLLGIPFGIISCLNKNSLWQSFYRFIILTAATFPSFLLSSLLILFFCQFLHLLPPARLDTYSSFILPVITLAFRPIALVAEVVKDSLQSEIGKEYIKTAKSKGLGVYKIIIHHALKNIWVPVIAVLGPVAANILTGSFIVEHFFAIPGMAKHFIYAVMNRDLFLIMGVTLVFSLTLILINLFCDLIYPFLDPRITQKGPLK